ncbi:hypothetical protein KK083_25550 [Fulvivirgaceae bacterium PWU4]|uniref:Uncharacterized protein n=1 Tax=Chryseosolibacter histidini TaxID=2782349 RepID=A0AAP2DPT5_9BACT|nr:hypothetical protein [Chryseosolibacter histidini]MBT1700278.1 hypothetical protein [Chryseosolibacter histidini]
MDDHIEKINSVEAKAGRTLPPSLKEWICFIEHMLKTDQWIFRDSYDISFSEKFQAVTLMIQGEADYYWAVKIENLSFEDPPVDGYLLDYEGDTGDFLHHELKAHRLTSFVLKYLLDYHYMFVGTGGYFTPLTNRSKTIEEFAKALGPYVRIEDYLVFESETVIAYIVEDAGDPDRGGLGVHYRAAIHELPACVKNNFSERTMHYGFDLRRG